MLRKLTLEEVLVKDLEAMKSTVQVQNNIDHNIHWRQRELK